jgi:predicted NBD/HSP70 family sugar kinase
MAKQATKSGTQKKRKTGTGRAAAKPKSPAKTRAAKTKTESSPPHSHAPHGAEHLSSVIVDSYNLEIRDGEGFVGDRASGRAFRALLDDLRGRLKEVDQDPLGDEPKSRDISKKKLDKILADGAPEAAATIHGTVEEFAQELAGVIRLYLKEKSWKGTQRIVVGGGLKDSRVGELAVGRAGVILKAEGTDIALEVIRHHPDEAGLIGCAHLAPAWSFEGFDGLLAVDIGGSNIRCGIVETRVAKSPDLSDARVWKFELWRHAEEKPGRTAAVEHLLEMLKTLVALAEKEKRRLAPFIGIGCPGIIRPDGGIERGGQNLPGNWESERFNLPALLREALPRIAGHDTMVVMHNDAVVQGLSQTPFMQDVAHWGVLTIGTGLGNARFTNRREEPQAEKTANKKKD